MARTNAPARVTVEVFVEQRVIAPVQVALEGLVRAEDRAASVLPAQENVGQPTGKVMRGIYGIIPYLLCSRIV